MTPKCARPLSGARPSACADAIGHLGARPVCGPWPEDGGRTRGGSSAGPSTRTPSSTGSCSAGAGSVAAPLEILWSFVDLDRALRRVGGEPRAGAAADR